MQRQIGEMTCVSFYCTHITHACTHTHAHTQARSQQHIPPGGGHSPLHAAPEQPDT